MTITLDLPPHVEQGLIAKAAARGLSVADYLGEMAAREIVSPVPAAKDDAPEQTGSLHTFLMNSPLRGSDLDLERVRDYPREIDIE